MPKARPRKDDSNPKTRGNQKWKKKATVKPILGRINAPRLSNRRYQKLQPFVSMVKRLSETTSPTTFSMAIDATCTNAPDAIFTSPMMNSNSTTITYSDLALLIYVSIIWYHFQSNTIIKLNFKKVSLVNSITISSFHFSTQHCPLSRLHINLLTLLFRTRIVSLDFNKL